MKQFTTRLLNRAKQMVYDRDREGFTLIELIVVMAIISILVLLAAPQFIGYTKDAEVTAMQQDIKVLSDAALQAHIQTGDWPINEVSHSLTVDEEETLELKGLDKDIFDQYVKTLRRDISDYAIYTGSGVHKGDVFFIGNDGNGLTDRHGDTYYDLEQDVVSVTPGDTEFDDTPGDTELDDTTGAPGPKTLVAGNMQAGYFGTVSASELWDGDSLAALVDVSQGTPQYQNTDWLKFASKGKIIYRPMKPIRHSISWDHLNQENVVFGNKEITHADGTKYKIRLMKGVADGIENIEGLEDRGTHGSEWNNLMMPIHERASENNWSAQHTNHTVHEVDDWGIGFTDKDLHAHYTHGNGTYVWVQEAPSSGSSSRVARGDNGVSYSSWNTSSNSNAFRGWAPVLEVVE